MIRQVTAGGKIRREREPGVVEPGKEVDPSEYPPRLKGLYEENARIRRSLARELQGMGFSQEMAARALNVKGVARTPLPRLRKESGSGEGNR